MSPLKWLSADFVRTLHDFLSTPDHSPPTICGYHKMPEDYFKYTSKVKKKAQISFPYYALRVPDSLLCLVQPLLGHKEALPLHSGSPQNALWEFCYTMVGEAILGTADNLTADAKFADPGGLSYTCCPIHKWHFFKPSFISPTARSAVSSLPGYLGLSF